MSTRAIGCIAIAATALVACDQAKDTALWDPPLSLLQHQSPAGIYVGALTDTSGAHRLPQPVTALIDVNGHAQIIFPLSAQRHVAGRVDVSGESLTGTLTEYFGTFAGFYGVGGIAPLVIDGTVDAGTSIVGEYTAETHSGRVVLDYHVAYDNPSSLGFTEGVWSSSIVSSGGSIYTVTWEIDGNGQVFGADTLGCVFIGETNVVDATVNAYSLAIQISSCGYFDGDYAGQAFLSTGSGGMADWLTLGVANDAVAFSTALQRQSPP